jgi:hypothetical protein
MVTINESEKDYSLEKTLDNVSMLLQDCVKCDFSLSCKRFCYKMMEIIVSYLENKSNKIQKTFSMVAEVSNIFNEKCIKE